jgi:pimeloyl-ACP methyl ester carboxylesterase
MTSVPQDLYVDLDNLTLHYRDWGGDGRPLVLVHGLASTCRIWDLVAPLLARSFRVVAVDQRGHGESDKPDAGYDFATMSGDLRAFVDGLGLRQPVLVGHSWGGDVAVSYAHRFPGQLSGICAVDGGIIELAALPDMTHERAREQLAPPQMDGMTWQSLFDRAQSWLGFPPSPEIVESTKAIFAEQDDGTIRPRFSRSNHMQVIDALWDHRPSELYPDLDIPVLLMPTRMPGASIPEERRVAREQGMARAAKLIPTSATVWLENTIHDAPLQRPELVAETIERHVREGFFG